MKMLNVELMDKIADYVINEKFPASELLFSYMVSDLGEENDMEREALVLRIHGSFNHKLLTDYYINSYYTFNSKLRSKADFIAKYSHVIANNYEDEKYIISEEEAIYKIAVLNQLSEMLPLNIENIRETGIFTDFLQYKYALAYCKLYSKGTTANYREAFRLFNELLEENPQKGINATIGYMYENGLGVNKDEFKAIEYYQRGIIEEDSESLYRMGMCYLNGIGVLKDKNKAIDFFRLSKLTQSYKQLASLYFDESGYEKAYPYYLKAAKELDPDSLYNVGYCLYEGKGVETDIEEATKYFIYASYFNQKDALYMIGNMYLKGIYFTKDIDQGLRYINRAKNYNNPDAYNYLGSLYESGTYVEKNRNKAIEYYQKAKKLSDEAL